MSIRMMTDSGPALSADAIKALEQKLAARLPAAYKRFLLRHNGGRPEPPYFRQNVLAEFLGVNPKDKVCDLLANRKSLREWIPPELLPVARDCLGDMVCLAIRGKNRGKVYSWDHEGGTEQIDWEAVLPGLKLKPYEEGEPRPRIKDDWPGHPDLTLIADSFTEFLESFHDEPELDDGPEGDGGPEDEPPEPEPASPREAARPAPVKPAIWDLPTKPRKASKAKAPRAKAGSKAPRAGSKVAKAKAGSKAAKAKAGSKAARAKPRAGKATKTRSRGKE